MKIFHLCLVLWGAALSGCSDGSSPSDTLPSLVYQEIGESGGRIVRVNADGGQRQVLWEAGPRLLGSELSPSPDGASILFETTDGWLLLPTSGGNASPFTAPVSGMSLAARPVWAPDAASIAWILSERVGIAPPGSSSAQFITPDSLHVRSASWSPDGTQLVFCTVNLDHYSETRLWLVGRDGTDLRPLSPESLIADCSQSWSPDGSKIAFAARSIWTIAPQGSSLRIVALDEGGYADGVFWSPNSRAIMAIDQRNHHLHRIGVTDGSSMNLRLRGALDNPWSPDGSRIFFLSEILEPDGVGLRQTVNVARPNGAESIRISPDTVNAFAPAWLP